MKESWKEKPLFGRLDKAGREEYVGWRDLTFQNKIDLVKALVLMGYLMPVTLMGAHTAGTRLFDYIRMPECSDVEHSTHGGACKTRDLKGEVVMHIQPPNHSFLGRDEPLPQSIRLVIKDDTLTDLEEALKEIGFPDIHSPGPLQEEIAKLHDPNQWSPVIRKSPQQPAPLESEPKPDPRFDQKGLEQKLREIDSKPPAQEEPSTTPERK